MGKFPFAQPLSSTKAVQGSTERQQGPGVFAGLQALGGE